jgi:hypothetical protein
MSKLNTLIFFACQQGRYDDDDDDDDNGHDESSLLPLSPTLALLLEQCPQGSVWRNAPVVSHEAAPSRDSTVAGK